MPICLATEVIDWSTAVVAGETGSFTGTLPALLDEWDREAGQFKKDRQPYLLYR